MADRFTLLIDESGEAGIGRVRSKSAPGASPYMTLGATLIREQSRAEIEESLKAIKSKEIKKPLHCSKLSHYQILYFARQIMRHEMRFFGVISRKATLGSYQNTIADDSSMYYNKCAQYLLERVGLFMDVRCIPPDNLNIVFEKANINYDKMRNLIWTCQRNPKHKNTKFLKFINVENITEKKKDDEPLLQIADLVAHALYKCVDKTKSNFEIPEPRYLRELAPKFFGHPETNALVGGGLYCVHSISDLQMDTDVESMLRAMSAIPPSPK